jgi:hypothetical protein
VDLLTDSTAKLAHRGRSAGHPADSHASLVRRKSRRSANGHREIRHALAKRA